MGFHWRRTKGTRLYTEVANDGSKRSLLRCLGRHDRMNVAKACSVTVGRQLDLASRDTPSLILHYLLCYMSLRSPVLTWSSMSPPYEPMITMVNQTYWPEPYSLLEVPPSVQAGLAALGTLALVSVTAVSATLCFIIYRLIAWRSYYACFPCGTQCIILILNLLLADLQQSLALTISFHWLRIGSVLAPSAACTLQGWLLHAGDVSSGFFVLGIGLHTYLLTAHQMEMSNRWILLGIGLVWIFSYFLASLGVAMHGHVET